MTHRITGTSKELLREARSGRECWAVIKTRSIKLSVREAVTEAVEVVMDGVAFVLQARFPAKLLGNPDALTREQEEKYRKSAAIVVQMEAVELVIVPDAVYMKIGLTKMRAHAIIMGIDCLRFANWILNAFAGTRNAAGLKSSTETVLLSARTDDRWFKSPWGL